MRPLPALASTTAGAVLAWMTLLQFVLTPATRAPWPIFVALGLGWAVAAALVAARPRLGGAFAALLGLASTAGALQSHGAPLAWDNLVLAGLAFAAGAAGVWAAWREGR